MSLVYGRDKDGKTVPLLVDANGAPIMAAVDAGGAYHVIKLDAVGHIIPVGVDAAGAYREIKVTSGGNLLPMGSDGVGNYRLLLMDASGRLVIAGEDISNARHPMRTDGVGRPVIAGQDSLALPRPVRTDASGRLVVAGEDSGANPQPILTDIVGRPVIAGQDSTGTPYAIRTTALGRIENALHTYYAAGWRRQAFIWGYYGAGLDALVYTTLAAGNYTFTGNAVPANTVWEVGAVSAVDITTAVTALHINVFDGANGCRFAQVAAPAANAWLVWSGNIRLAAGWRIQAVFTGVALGDVLNLRYSYTSMPLNL